MTGTDRDRALERMVCGDWSPSSDDARQRTASDPAIADAWRELRWTQAALDDVAPDPVDAVPNDDDRRVAAAFFEPRIHAGQARRTGRRALVAAVAASVLVVVALALRSARSSPEPEPGPMLLGTGSIVELVHPVGAAEDFGRFEWRSTEGPNGSFVLRIFDREDRLLYERWDIDRSPWLAEPEVRARLERAETIRWEVTAMDGEHTTGFGRTWSSYSGR